MLISYNVLIMKKITSNLFVTIERILFMINSMHSVLIIINYSYDFLSFYAVLSITP